jgi:hypothetical protein
MRGGPRATVRKRILPDPGSMSNYAQALGQTFYFRVVGSTSGNIWGTDVYTHDSTLAAAAVHAGVLRAGETGVVKVTMMPALANYHGSVNNGVTSGSWTNDGSYVSYKVEKAGAMPPRAGGATRLYDSTRHLNVTDYDLEGTNTSQPKTPSGIESDEKESAPAEKPLPMIGEGRATEAAPAGSIPTGPIPTVTAPADAALTEAGPAETAPTEPASAMPRAGSTKFESAPRR